MPRSVLLLALLAVGAADTAAGDRIPWTVDAPAALRRAEEERRPLLFLFSGSPCPTAGMPGKMADTRTGAREGGAPGPGSVPAYESDCARLDTDVLTKSEVVAAAARYVPVVLDPTEVLKGGETRSGADLLRRFDVRTIPTLLVADPWGNEIIRMVGATARPSVLRLLNAIPADFTALRATGEALRQDASSTDALVQAAGFYASHGLGPVAELYYGRAATTRGAEVEAVRREIVLARGLNLLRMNKGAEAATLFEAEATRAPDAAQGDAILFGWAMGALAAGDRARADAVVKQMEQRFPASRYTTKMRENLAAGAPAK